MKSYSAIKVHRFYTLLLPCTVALIASCTNNSTDGITAAALTDTNIFNTAQQSSGYIWYKKSDTYLTRSAKSGHSEPFQRTRLDATAATQLDAVGKVKNGAVFPEGSTIVKELVNSDRSLSGYAVLIKRKSDPNADASGWVWGQVTAAGNVRNSVSNKGGACIDCHSIAGNIDRTLMNVSNP